MRWRQVLHTILLFKILHLNHEIFKNSAPSQETPSSGFSKYHQLHRMTKQHWRLQSEKNKENLDKIISSLDESLVLREKFKIKNEYVFTTF